MKTRYTVMVGRSQVVGRDSLRPLAPSPDYECGHEHRSYRTAGDCLARLQHIRQENGKWVESARWYNAYIHAHLPGTYDYLPDFRERFLD